MGYSHACANASPRSRTYCSQVEYPVRAAHDWSCPGTPVAAHMPDANVPLLAHTCQRAAAATARLQATLTRARC